MSFPIPPAAPGAPAKGTTDTEIQPSDVGGGKVPAPSRAWHLCTPSSWGRSPEHSHPLLPGTGTSPAGDRDLAPALPFPGRQGCREGTSTAVLPWSFSTSPGQAGREGGRWRSCAQASIPPHRANAVGVLCSPGPGLGWDGAASLVLLPSCSHRAQLCHSASRAACSLNSSRQTLLLLLLGHGVGAAPEAAQAGAAWPKGSDPRELQGPRAPRTQEHPAAVGMPILPCSQAHDSLRKGCWALAPPGPGRLSSPGHFTFVVGVQLGRHLRVHLAQAPMELSTVQLLQLHFPVTGWAGDRAGLLLWGTGQP